MPRSIGIQGGVVTAALTVLMLSIGQKTQSSPVQPRTGSDTTCAHTPAQGIPATEPGVPCGMPAR
jgi:hypothetical protein